jgi:hypothetical protein
MKEEKNLRCAKTFGEISTGEAIIKAVTMVELAHRCKAEPGSAEADFLWL